MRLKLSFWRAAKTNKSVAHDLLFDSPVSSDDQTLFQVFFLSEDQSQGVEVLETNELDLGEICQRLKMGETVFIKYKNQEPFESHSKVNTDEERKFWYFTHC